MPVEIDGRAYYRTAEVCQLIGISRTTLFRWLKAGSFAEAKYRDRRGWRLFTEEEVEKMRTEANRLVEAARSAGRLVIARSEVRNGGR